MFTCSVFILVFISCSTQCWSLNFDTNSNQTEAKSCKSTERLCQSGECYPKRIFCDGISDCADGSDEISSNCANTTGKEKSEETCRSLTSFSLDIICSRNGLEVDCTKPVLHGTVANISCKQFYQLPPNSKISAPSNNLLCENGSWNNSLMECIPVCGLKNSKAKSNITEGIQSKIGEYPWHVGIYKNKRVISTLFFHIEKYFQICSGSIISPKMVVSAAHCFESRDPTEYGVGAGKYYKLWNDDRDLNAQMRNVEQILIPETYNGLQNNYMNDIAILIVDESFVFDNVVRPVCIDWTAKIHKQLLQSGSIGYISGWGVEHEQKDPTESILLGDNNAELKQFQLQFVSSDVCLKDSSVDFQQIVGQYDKNCAGGADNKIVCNGDGGAGLSFQLGELFYLMGIKSIEPKNCDSSKFATYTNFSSHTQWAENIYQTKRLSNSTQLQDDDVEELKE